MSWERTHRRYDLVRTVLDEVRRRWYQTFDARLDALLEHAPRDLHAAVHHLRHALEREQPEVVELLAAHPAPTAVDLHHRRTLRAATGVDERDPAASA